LRTVSKPRRPSADPGSVPARPHLTALGDLARVAQEADPKDKADIYAKLRLTLPYQPGEKLVQATIKPGLNMCKGFVSEDRGLPIAQANDLALTTAFVLGGAR
jgi:hypothetical protein